MQPTASAAATRASDRAGASLRPPPSRAGNPTVDGPRHTRAMMLISVEELATRLDDPTIRLADVRWFVGEPGRGRREYDAGHLPGAVFVDLDRDLAASTGAGRHPLPDPATFARRMGELGIGRDDLVIA